MTAVSETASAELPTAVAAPERLLPSFPTTSLAAHLERYGPLPAIAGRREQFLDEVEAAGLTGRGGAGFPTARKLRTVARNRRTVVVANGTEGEPASAKDKTLMTRNPHLVLDGVLVAGELVGAGELIVAVSHEAETSLAALREALAQRPDDRRIRIEATPERFVAGEETALVHWLNGGEAKPTFAPPRPFERGVGGRPTLVQNVETLANLALIARRGPEWFRSLGTDAEPGSVLLTVRGAVRRPGVVEVALGTPLRSVVSRCGGLTGSPQAVLVGGYFGAWIAPDADLLLTNEALRPLGAALGARTIVVLPESTCGVAETARVATYMAAQSAGQCGPCVFGLAAVAECLQEIADCRHGAADALERLPRLEAQIARRGACAHPDGTLGFIRSALDVFADEIDAHLAGGCTATSQEALLPTPHLAGGWR
jgi:NADH:ubiquinone oxidoreductase subunit F (NADH-binding)